MRQFVVKGAHLPPPINHRMFKDKLIKGNLLKRVSCGVSVVVLLLEEETKCVTRCFRWYSLTQ